MGLDLDLGALLLDGRAGFTLEGLRDLSMFLQDVRVVLPLTFLKCRIWIGRFRQV